MADDLVEKEAEEESSASANSDDEEEDVEEEETAEDKAFLDDDDEEAGGSETDDKIGRQKRKRRRVADDNLEEDDYDLLEENLGVKLKRKKKFSRVKAAFDEEESGEEEGDRDIIANQLFDAVGDDVSVAAPKARSVAAPATDFFAPMSSSDEDVNDFIVDDNGESMSRRKKKSHRVYSSKQLEEAQEVFGVDLDEFQDLVDDDDFDDAEDYDPLYGSGEEDVDELTPRHRKRKPRDVADKKSIYEIFEPSELEKKHYTDRDEEIRVADIPERFQIDRVRSYPVQPVDESTNELELEADWIYKQVFRAMTISDQSVARGDFGGSSFLGEGSGANAVSKIKQALHFIRNESFEVPFIANYRREYVEPDLNSHDLWKVYQWDEKWCKIQLRKRNLRRLFETVMEFQRDKIRENPDHLLPEGSRPLTENDIERVDSLQTHEELKDAHDHFCLYYKHDLVELQRQRRQQNDEKDPNETTPTDLNLTQSQLDQTRDSGTGGGLKRIARRDFYFLCREAGLLALAEKFGLTPEKYGENLRDNYQRHETEQYPHDPEQIAEEFICQQFPNVESVLRGAVHMVAVQLAKEPVVKQAVRQAFVEKARIAVKPTKKGQKEIDEHHDLSPLKYLKNKPVKNLQGDEFARLRQGERDGLVTISIDMISADDYGNATSYLNEMKQLYYRDEFRVEVENWNRLRSDAVEKAYKDFLFPSAEKELRHKLDSEARDSIALQCAHKLRQWINVAPYVTDAQRDDGSATKAAKGTRVLACSFEDDREAPVHFAVLDGSGRLVESFEMHSFAKRGRVFRQNEIRWKEDAMRTMTDKLKECRPQVIVIAAESRDAITLKENLENCTMEVERELELTSIPIEIVDPQLARVVQWARKDEFPNVHAQVRLALSLGRRLQDPLVEFASLCAEDDTNLLSLHIHPRQSLVPAEMLLPVLQIEIINQVNSVGVDVNRALDDERYAHMLQFVCGLGPRKGAALLKLLKRKGMMLENRSQLVTRCSMGPKVFLNCAGFIRIDSSAFANSSAAQEYAEILDGSRIHPETYEWARKMAIDALEYDESADDTTPQSAVEEILESPEKLRDLDLDAFAVELERQGFGSRGTTLYEIRDELFAMYKEKRAPYQPLTPEELFTTLTGETEATLCRGRLITCTVTSIARRQPDAEALQSAVPLRDDETNLLQCPFCFEASFNDPSAVWNHCDGGSCPGQPTGVRTRLDNGITGFINLRNLSDKSVKNPSDRVQSGMSIYCRILRLNMEKFQVDLTSKSSDLAGSEEFEPERDKYYDIESAEADKIQKKKQTKQSKSAFVKRMIVHPAFHNVAYKQAEQVMASMDVGDCIIRPSSKGNDHLTVTWKVDESLYQHIDIQEKDKENPVALGNRLVIGDEEYEDLDEIIARHMQPMASFARELFSYKYYRHADGGKKAVLEQLLSVEKKKASSRIPYFFSACRDLPGKFLLCYQPRSKPITEYVSVSPGGYRYRGQVHPSLPSLLQYFKEHYREPPPVPPPRNVAPYQQRFGVVEQGGRSEGPTAFASAYQGVGQDRGRHRGRWGGADVDAPASSEGWGGDGSSGLWGSGGDDGGSWGRAGNQENVPWGADSQPVSSYKSSSPPPRGEGTWNRGERSWDGQRESRGNREGSRGGRGGRGRGRGGRGRGQRGGGWSGGGGGRDRQSKGGNDSYPRSDQRSEVWNAGGSSQGTETGAGDISWGESGGSGGGASWGGEAAQPAPSAQDTGWASAGAVAEGSDWGAAASTATTDAQNSAWGSTGGEGGGGWGE